MFAWLRELIASYGYWAVAAALLLESAGLPVPGEITLLLASFLAFDEHRLRLEWIIVAGTAAGALGGNLGYALGVYGGRPLLERYQTLFRIDPAVLQRGEEMFARYGAATVFVSRFIFGLRFFAGPLAGVLHMRWRVFALFNFLGAAVWVTTMAGVGYVFGRHWHELLHFMQRFNLAALALAVLAFLYLWWRRRHREPVRALNHGMSGRGKTRTRS